MRKERLIWVGGGRWEDEGGGFTLEFLEYSLHGAGAAAAGHGDVEFVEVVCGHFGVGVRYGVKGRGYDEQL